MRAAELSNRAMELKKELEEMQQLEQEYVANPNATLGDFRGHCQRQLRFQEIADELIRLAEETAH